jgi:hypothetical protein
MGLADFVADNRRAPSGEAAGDAGDAIGRCAMTAAKPADIARPPRSGRLNQVAFRAQCA